MNANKIHGALGLCMRAGKCVSGDFTCEKTIKANKAKLVVLDQSAADNTKERYEHICQKNGIPLVYLEDMGCAIGKPGRMIAVVTDERFEKMILDAVQSK